MIVSHPIAWFGVPGRREKLAGTADACPTCRSFRQSQSAPMPARRERPTSPSIPRTLLCWPKPGWVRAMARARHLRLRRRALAVVFACQGFMSAAADGHRSPESRAPVRRIASHFSLTIRRYSTGKQVPQAIIMVRRAIVSQEASVSSIIFGAREAGPSNIKCFVLRRFIRSSLRLHLIGAHREIGRDDQPPPLPRA